MEHSLNPKFYAKGYYLMFGIKEERNGVIIAEYYDLEILDSIIETLNELDNEWNGKDSADILQKQV